VSELSPSSSDGTLQAIEHTARRWAVTRFTAYRTAEAQTALEFPEPLFDELREQGWLPGSAQELGVWSPRMVAHLGEALGRDAGAAFLPILTHVVAAHLLPASQFPVLASRAAFLATSPFWDFSRVRSPVVMLSKGGRWVLEGRLPMVVVPKATSLMVVPASSPEGVPLIATAEPTSVGIVRGELRSTLGLRGAPVRSVEFRSVPVDACVAEGQVAKTALANASQVLVWGTVGLLSGIVGKASDAATDYANLRFQGGRRIVEHAAVAKLLDVVHRTKRQLELWLRHIDGCGSAVGPVDEAGVAARSATDAALQVFGGVGYICPSVAERCWRDARQAAALASAIPYFTG